MRLVLTRIMSQEPGNVKPKVVLPSAACETQNSRTLHVTDYMSNCVGAKPKVVFIFFTFFPRWPRGQER